MERKTYEKLLKGNTRTLKLNLASGDQEIPEFLNIDLHYPADIRDDIRVLSSITDDTCDEIYIAHAIMYLTDPEMEECLRACYRKLAKGGKIFIEDPKESARWEWTYARSPKEVCEALNKCRFRKISETKPFRHSRHNLDKVWTVEGTK